jgi:hypothetical protein
VNRDGNKKSDPRLSGHYLDYLLAMRNFTEELSKEMKNVLADLREPAYHIRPPGRTPQR